MNPRTCTLVAAGMVALAGTAAHASYRGSGPSVFIDVLAVNGSPAAGIGVKSEVLVQQGDVITFGIIADISSLTDDNLSTGTIRLADVGPFGTVDLDSVQANSVLTQFIDPPMEPLQFGDNGLNIQFFDLPGGNALGPTSQLGTFEFVVTADTGSFRYDTLQDPPAPNNPANALETQREEFLLFNPNLNGDLIIIPTPGAFAAFGLVAGLGATRRRRA